MVAESDDDDGLTSFKVGKEKGKERASDKKEINVLEQKENENESEPSSTGVEGKTDTAGPATATAQALTTQSTGAMLRDASPRSH